MMLIIFFFKQKTAYEMRISDWSSDVCSSDLAAEAPRKVVLIASGSEVPLALETAAKLEAEGVGADVVSMPCWELFDAQDASYRSDLLPGDVLKVSIEAGATFGWERYTGLDGLRDRKSGW